MNNEFELSEQYKNSKNTATCQVSFIGDKITVRNVLKLLAYIRYAIQNKQTTTIKVNIGKNVMPEQFMFDVNSEPMPNVVTQDTIEIN